MDLSVIIPTRDKAPSLRATLACLATAELAPAGTPPLEVIVVDDRSTDATGSVVARFAGRLLVRTIRGRGRGRAAARNDGADTAAGTRLLFLDDDILTGSGFLAAHNAHATTSCFVHGPLHEFPGARRWLEDHAGDDDHAVAGASVAVLDGSAPRARLVRNTLEAAILAMAADDGGGGVVGWLAAVGANLSLPAAQFRAVGGFDEGFGTGWGCEDLELGIRLELAGLNRVVDPAARGVHLSHARPGRWDEHDRNLARFCALHDRAEVRALPALLGEGGGLIAYRAAMAADAAARL